MGKLRYVLARHFHRLGLGVALLFAMQAAEQPQKRFVMMSIEQCLTDLKMTADALDSFEGIAAAFGTAA